MIPHDPLLNALQLHCPISHPSINPLAPAAVRLSCFSKGGPDQCHDISEAVCQSDQVAGCGVWAVFAIFCALVLVATTFISHTVGAMVILPIVSAVGTQMEVRCWSGFAYYGM